MAFLRSKEYLEMYGCDAVLVDTFNAKSRGANFGLKARFLSKPFSPNFYEIDPLYRELGRERLI